MRLVDLIAGLPEATVSGDAALDIRAIAFDSRQVAVGGLFVALRGGYTDGHAFVADAAGRGAVAALVEAPVMIEGLAAQVVVPDTRAALARVAARFHGEPSRQIGVIGVTGTDGKTTTTYFISALLEYAGLATGLIGTVDIKIGPNWLGNPSRQTTPESLEVQALLRQMVDVRLDWAIVESTSHGLAMHRLDNVAYDIAVLTNLTHEHLDFHGTIEAYRAAKAQLFEMVAARPPKDRPRLAIVNADDPHAPRFLAAAGDAPALRYGIADATAEVRAIGLELAPDATRCMLRTPRGSVPLRLALIGDFNVANALAAAAVGEGLGLPLDQIAAGLASLRAVPGRLERIDQGQPFLVVVDYAHTPDSLAKMLRLLRPLTTGRLIAVFGSAGERDVAKRAIQGRVSQELADMTVVTSEDPRFEDAGAIVAEIAAGAIAAGGRPGEDLYQEPDRQAAVHLAVGLARPGDTVLLAGNGHEQSIIVGADKVPWDDRAAARAALQAHGWTEDR
ncbi:MAG: UDP-N-acetylmuramoyl-L-alanyl-D-glutamate--2,6-diaminopimelate ligase [Chloroflexi bacterium]|nr:UDP-N-acetylmuramoyl-L-alanyl-D-glutamate--2,6-diaminopimelate ligase [Chloroflexota bacterium]